MKEWYRRVLVSLGHSMSGSTSEELVSKASDNILSDVINSDLTIRQQTDILVLTLKKLSDYRKTQIEETQSRLEVLEEDYNKLILIVE